MTEAAAPPTHKTPEQLLAQLIELLASILYAVVDASLLPRAYRRRLRAAFADYFASLTARFATLLESDHWELTRHRRDNDQRESASHDKAPHQPRAPKRPASPTDAQPATPRDPTRPHAPPFLPNARAPSRTPSRSRPSPTAFAPPNPQHSQKPAFTLRHSRAHIITI